MDEIIRNLAPPLGVGLISLFGYLWARGVHRRARIRARRKPNPVE
ncbi:MAG: hypothetical protein WBR13_03435 [Allosphingosinicella sp.]